MRVHEVIARELAGGIERNAEIAGRFEAESDVIAEHFDGGPARVYVDLGCWYGLLLERVLAKCSPSRVVALDAVAELLEAARSRVTEGRVEFVNAVILPEEGGASAADFKVQTADSSMSGLFVEGGAALSHVPRALSVCELLDDLKLGDLSDVYLKMDLEGCDALIVRDLLRRGLRPAALHFEVPGPTEQTTDVFRLLIEAGYRVPRFEGAHGFYSAVCSPARACLVGFEPTAVYRQ